MRKEIADSIFKNVKAAVKSPYVSVGAREIRVGKYHVKVIANAKNRFMPGEFVILPNSNRWSDVQQMNLTHDILHALAADEGSGLRMTAIDRYMFVVQDEKFNEYTIKVYKPRENTIDSL